MKTRIKESIDSNGKSRYMVQIKFLFFWRDAGYTDTMEKALEWANYDHEDKIIIHKID
jgi:hypothetical protein